MTVTLSALCVEAADPTGLARFWAGVLGWTPADDPAGAAVLPTDGTAYRLRLVAGDTPRGGRNTSHLHLTSRTDDDQRRTVERVLALGGRHLDVGQRPEEGHVVLADPEGNEFCVIEAGNRYLEGTGFLGELACDGSRDVGLFWAAALGWPLVWDQDGETAVQAPAGGTKISWGGESVGPGPRQDRLHLDVVGDGSEVDRLLGLGATPRAGGACPGAVGLADPDGAAFCVVGR